MKTLRQTSTCARNALVVTIVLACTATPEITWAKARTNRSDRTAERAALKQRKPPTTTGLKFEMAAAKPTAATRPLADSAATDPDTRDKLRFDRAKAQAANDPQVRMLKAKADSSLSEDQFRSAAIAYNKALFAKMREIDRGAEDWIDRVEAGVLRRIGGE